MGNKQKSFLTDYKRFADKEDGLLPYLASVVKELISTEDDDGLQQLVTDIAFVSDSLYELNKEIVNAREEYEKMKLKRDAIRKALEEKRSAEREIEEEMARRFGIRPSIVDDSENINPQLDIDIESNDKFSKLIEEADSISNSIDELADINTDKIQTQSDESNHQIDVSSNVLPDSTDAIVEKENSTILDGIVDNDSVTKNAKEPNDKNSGDVFPELDNWNARSGENYTDNDDMRNLINTGIVFDSDIDTIVDNQDRASSSEYGDLVDTYYEPDLDVQDSYQHEISDTKCTPSNALYSDENKDDFSSEQVDITDSDTLDQDIQNADDFDDDNDATDLFDDFSDDDYDSTEKEDETIEAFDEPDQEEDIFGDDDYTDNQNGDDINTESSKNVQQTVPKTKNTLPRGNAFLDADIFSM